RYGETLFLAKDGAELLAEEVHWYMDGASVVVKHVGGFESEVEYQVRLTEEIKGLPKANIIKADNNSENGEDDGWRGRHYFAEEVHWYMDGASVVVEHVLVFESEAQYQVRLTEEITGLPKANIIKADNNSENGEDDGWRGRHYFAEEGEPGTGAPIAEEVFSF